MVVVEETAALEHLKHRPRGRMTQRKAKPRHRRLPTRGLDQLNQGQICLGDRINIDNARFCLGKRGDERIMRFTNT